MFETILIANRGEIACRVMRTARRLGIRTVAVYSSADEGARHVREADESVGIGPPAARESYLNIERIVAAAQARGAQAIHPGYGFLSESAPFAEACARAGLCFIGPPPAAIRAMGSKSAAKALMQAAGVPLTPGYHGDDQDPDLLAAEAARIGFPVLIKASAGGGGKGMRRVDAAGEFAGALAACRREALAAFGSDQVLVEKYILQPRHIEIQVFADTQGRVVYLFERDCSVQRRHQKVLEEAPAPGMTPARRQAMGQAAVQVARSVGYVGAGTVEFIAPRGDDSFYFMEMNTRLQVEHPVTEMITGLDLVEWQLRVAAGEPLPLAQEQLQIRGHAIEARIYAEDPEQGFTPATGSLELLEVPEASPHVRLDAGVEQGDAITPYYDPMIAKLIAWDLDRDRARARLRTALAQMRIVGVTNNLAFLARLVDAPSFAGALLDTDLIERDAQALAAPAQPPEREYWLLAVLAHLEREAIEDRRTGHRAGPWDRRDGWRANRPARRSLQLEWSGPQGGRDARVAKVSDSPLGATAAAREAGGVWITLDGRAAHGSLRRSPGADVPDGAGLIELHALIDGHLSEAGAYAQGARWHVFGGHRGAPPRRLVHHIFECRDPQHEVHGPGEDVEHQGTLLAPMPGKVIALLVAPGTQVARDTPLLIVEAMKMEHSVRAPAAGILRAYRVTVGEQVAMGAQLMAFEPEGAAAARETP